MQTALPLACFLSMIRPPGIQFEEALLQIAPVNKAKCPYVKNTNDIEFRLYTRHNPTVYQELKIDDDEKLFASNLDYHAPTVVYFHAYMETTDDGSAARIRESYIIRGDTNIIMVDASRLEAGPWYFTAAENTWYIGNFAAKFVDFLVSRGLDLGKTHFVGHSLGAQAAGVAGYALKSGRVARITGLDPALPLFHGLPLEQRLDKSDAEFVDVIHTDGGIFGINHPLGHADFYPNGGISPQPGCELEVVFSQQMLLNKCKALFKLPRYLCENNTQPLGFYTFYLTPYKTKSTLKLEKGLQKLFTKIRTSKRYNNYQPIKDKLFTTEDLRSKEIKHKNEMMKFEDQVMVESVNKYYKIIPYFVAINKDDNAGTMKPVVKRLSIETKTENILAENSAKEIDTDKNEDGETQTDKEVSLPKTIATNEQSHENSETISHYNTTAESIDEDNDAKETVKTKIDQNKSNNQESQQIKTHINQEDSPQKTTTQNKQENSDKTIYGLNSPKSQQIKIHINEEDSQQKTTTQNKQIKQNSDTYGLNSPISHVIKRHKRFINLFQKTPAEEQQNFLFRIMGFLFKTGRNIPVYSIMREINTLVKSGQGELNHALKETNNYIGAPPPVIPVTYSLELGNENKAVAFMKKLLGLTPKGDRLTISGTGK